MNLALLFAILTEAPSLIEDVEAAASQVKASPDLYSKAQAAIAGFEKLSTDVIPTLKSL